MEKTTIDHAVLKRALVSGGIGAALTLLLTFLCALCLGGTILPQGREALWARGILALSGLIAGFLACRKQSAGKLLCAGAAAAVLLVFVLLLGAVTENSSVINISLLLNLVCIIFGVLAGCLLTARRVKRRKRK